MSRAAATKASQEMQAAPPPSLVAGVSVWELRKRLDCTRQAWCTSDAPFFFSDPIAPATHESQDGGDAEEQEVQSREAFCVEYIMGKHVKRFIKSKRGAHLGKGAEEEVLDEEQEDEESGSEDSPPPPGSSPPRQQRRHPIRTTTTTKSTSATFE